MCLVRTIHEPGQAFVGGGGGGHLAGAPQDGLASPGHLVEPGLLPDVDGEDGAEVLLGGELTDGRAVLPGPALQGACQPFFRYGSR